MLAMDDGSRCLLDVIDDPQLLQSFLENTAESALNVSSNLDQTSHHKSVKSIDPKLAANLSMAAVVADSKQVDHVTSSGGNLSPILSLNNKSINGQLVIDDKQTINMVSSSVGLIPITSLSNMGTSQTLSISPSTMTTLTSTASMGQLTTSVPFRGTAPTWPPTSFQLAGPRGGLLTVQLPQQLILPPGAMQMTGPGGIQQLMFTGPRPGTPHGPGLPPGIQPGQLVHIIQTPNGPQILPANPAASMQSIVSTNSITKSSTTTSTSRSNKQILPKPPGSSVSANSNAVQTNSVNKCQQMTQQNTLKVLNSLPNNANQFTTTTIPTSGSGPQTQQILIGPNGQPAGVIGPQGTILLNHMLPGLGGQPILIQGNLGGVGNSVQLTLRPNSSHSSPMMTMSNGLSANEQNSALLNAVNKQSTQSPQPQTFVIPNNSMSSAVSSASPGMVMTNAGRSTPNIIFTRPPFFGAPQNQPTGQQFLQLQTPNGPVLVAIQTQPQLMQHHPSSASQPTHGIQLGNTMIPIGGQHLSQHLAPNMNTSIQTATHPALQALLASHSDGTSGQTVLQTSVPSVVTSHHNTVILTSQPQIITRPQLSSHSQQLKNSTVPSLNLADLLKDAGILPESSPPSSPTNNSLTDINTGAIHPELMHHSQAQSHQTVLMVPGGPNQPPNIVLTQGPVAPTAPPQLRLALGPDGSVILQPHITTNTNGLVPQIQSQLISNSNNLKFNDSMKDSSGLGSSQPSPDSTTPSIDATSTSSTTTTVSQTTTTSTTTTPSMGQNNTTTTSTSALLEQLNTGPAVKVPDLVASLALTHNSSTGVVVSHEESKPIQSQTALIPLTVQNINNSLEQKQQTIVTIPVQSGDNTSVVPMVSNGSSNAVIRIGSCDTIPTSLVSFVTTTPTTVFASPPPKTYTTGCFTTNTTTMNSFTVSSSPNNVNVTNGTTTTVIDQNGVPMIQVSPNNQEFLQRLDTQLKSLLTLKSPTKEQKELLQELLSLQQKMNVARSKTSDDQKLLITTSSPQQTLNNQISIDSQSQQPNMHLMNLLKQTQVNQSPTSQQIRLMTPVSAAGSPVNGTATIQVGNQLITFTTPVKQQLQNLKSIQTSNQTVVSKSQISGPQPPAVILRYTPTPTTASTFVTTSTTTKTSVIKSDPHLDKERRNAKVLKSIQQQLNVDQNAALKPDTKRPFNSRDDACKRLLRYHVFNSPVMTTSDMNKSDQLFEVISQHLLHKKQQLFDKFRVLLLKQSMKETASSEHVMIDRMFINEEINSLKTDKETVADGKSLNLPPAPQSWYQMIRSSIEEENKLFINRKRKSSLETDEEYNHSNSQIRRHEEPIEESDESEDEEEDSDDDDNEDKDDTISNFLQTTSDTSLGNVDNVGHYYDSYHNNLHIQNGSQMDGQSHVPLSGYVDTSQHHNELDIYDDINDDNCGQDWTDSLLSNNSSTNRRIAWNHRFGAETEAAVAVESILNDDDDDDDEPDMSVDLSGIVGLDDNLEVDEEDDEDDEEEDEDDDEEDEDDEVDDYGMGVVTDQHQHMDLQDMQTQCAIKSILDCGPVQQQSHTSHNSYAYHSHNTHTSHTSHHQHMNDYRNMDYSHINNIHDHSRRNEAMMRPYSQHSGGVNDPILDEAVKSILS